MVCWQGPPDFESGLATKVRFLPGEPAERSEAADREGIWGAARAAARDELASGRGSFPGSQDANFGVKE